MLTPAGMETFLASKKPSLFSSKDDPKKPLCSSSSRA